MPARQASSVSSSSWPAGGPPVLVTTSAGAPSRSTVAACQRSRSSGRVTSTCKARTSPPAARSSRSVAASGSAERDAIETRAPSLTSAAAMALPSPFDAAATIAVRPRMPRSMAPSIAQPTRAGGPAPYQRRGITNRTIGAGRRVSLAGGMAAAKRVWLLYACRSAYAAEVAEIIWRTGGDVAALVDNLPDGPQPSPIARVLAPADLADEECALPAAIPLITPGHRVAVAAEARAAGVRWFPPLVDPTAVIARTAAIAEGAIVNALAVIGARSRVGAFVHVNRSASIGHDADLGDFVTVGPGAVLAGHVTVESGAFVGAGAVVGPKVRIGARSTVGAGAVVMRDVPASVTV